MLRHRDPFQNNMVKFVKFYFAYLEFFFLPIWHIYALFNFIGHIIYIFDILIVSNNVHFFCFVKML